jgi:hypothetical protein
MPPPAPANSASSFNGLSVLRVVMVNHLKGKETKGTERQVR